MPAARIYSSVLAQVDKIAPAKDFPGADLVGNLLSWGMYLALALSVGSILLGAASWTWSRWGNAGHAVSGKNGFSAASPARSSPVWPSRS